MNSGKTAFQRSLTLDAEQPWMEEALTRISEAERAAPPRQRDRQH